MQRSGKGWGAWALLLGLALASQQVAAGPLLERLKARQADQLIQEDEDDAPAGDFLPEGARVLKDQAYGPDRRQRYDVYLPAQAQAAPIILMVHGGAWRFGSKSRGGVVEHKVARWVAQGFILVSTDYRLLPEAAPAEQARDVARALATVRARAAGWGGDPDRVVLMGHSAGAHLVALLAASPRTSPGVVGTVLLDSAALDGVVSENGK
ncbi:MAG: alpha/beta hydrolase [Rhodocyclaceae bacterium]|jgi:acetyl esterase/lipase|nr:alpha/beta hydrolase [Rhodocyclaceae bacterium]